MWFAGRRRGPRDVQLWIACVLWRKLDRRFDIGVGEEVGRGLEVVGFG
jgi:hypothetical protein